MMRRKNLPRSTASHSSVERGTWQPRKRSTLRLKTKPTAVKKATGNHFTNLSLVNMEEVSTQLAGGESGTSAFRGVGPGRGSSEAPQVDIKQNPHVKLNKKGKSTLKIGTWNVRTMLKDEKLENVKLEMIRNEIAILGIGETRWKEEGDFYSDEFRVIHSNGNAGQSGVAIILDSNTSKCVDKVTMIDDRIIMVKLKGEPVDVTVIQVYMPTGASDDQEVDKIYDQLDELITTVKGKEYLILMGDWNAVVGEGQDGAEVGQFGLGKRNERGEKLIDHCRNHRLVITNTIFKQEKRRRYTWKMPGDIGRYQIDYIMVKQRFRNSVKKSCSYPGADADSDHNLVCMKVKLQLKNIKSGKKVAKWDREQLKGEQGIRFRNDVEEELEQVEITTNDVNERWNEVKSIIKKSAKKNIAHKKRQKARKPWVTTQMLDKMDLRRKWKNVNTIEGKKEYKRLNNELRRVTERAREQWWNDQCAELEKLDKKGRSDLVYNKVRELCGVKRKNKEADFHQ